jgi:hypothetical protein
VTIKLCAGVAVVVLCLAPGTDLIAHGRQDTPSSVASTQQRSGSLPAEVVKVLRSCPSPPGKYTAPPTPDKIANVVTSRKHYQLVIGASDFQYSPESNRPFVAATARIVSARLGELGYTPLPSLMQGGESYITGAKATKLRIWEALKELASLATGPDVGIIYYVGHGAVTPSRRDLALATADRPVASDEGIRVSDIVGFLSLYHYPGSVREVPKFILVLETCYAGAAAVKRGSAVHDRSGVKVLTEVNAGLSPQPPEQMVVLSATGEDGGERAFDLKGSGLSAFGFFFTRAFREDWNCVDGNFDGIITVNELESYLLGALRSAHDALLIEAPMSPIARDEQKFSFLAYRSDRVVSPGDRERVAELFVTAPQGEIVSLSLPDGAVQVCQPHCTAYVSASGPGSLKIMYRNQASATSGRERPQPDHDRDTDSTEDRGRVLMDTDRDSSRDILGAGDDVVVATLDVASLVKQKTTDVKGLRIVVR